MNNQSVWIHVNIVYRGVKNQTLDFDIPTPELRSEIQ